MRERVYKSLGTNELIKEVKCKDYRDFFPKIKHGFEIPF